MEPEEEKYGCYDKDDNDAKDDNGSIPPDECWEETYRGQSRKWLLRDVFWKRTGGPEISTMKGTYRYPRNEEQPYIGQRRARLLDKLYDEAAEEIIRELNQPGPVQEYCTEYDGNYNNIPTAESGTGNEHEANKELYEKYPLDSSSAASYWAYNVVNTPPSKLNLPGFTTSIDPKNPFKRNSKFTTPLDEVMDVSDL